MNLYESEHFIIHTPDYPHVGRADGGHIIISPKVPIESRVELSPSAAKEFMKLSMVAGEAMTTVLVRHGVDLGRINYQDNGNWGFVFHLHLYGRAKSASMQKYGTPLIFPPTKEEFLKNMSDLEPLTAEDTSGIKEEILRLLETEKYKFF